MTLLIAILVVGATAWALWCIATSDMPRIDREGDPVLRDLSPSTTQVHRQWEETEREREREI